MDTAAFEELRSIMGDALGDIIDAYLESCPELIDEVGRHLGTGDAKALFETAHRLKSASGSLGAAEVASVAERLEMSGREGSTEGLTDVYDELRKAYAESADFLANSR